MPMRFPFSEWRGNAPLAQASVVMHIEGVPYRLNINVRLVDIVRKLAFRAATSKGKRASYMNGSVIVEAQRLSKGDLDHDAA